MMHIAAHGRNTEQALRLEQALPQLSNCFYSSKELGPAWVCSAASPASPLTARCTSEREHQGGDAIRAPRIPVINSLCAWEI